MTASSPGATREFQMTVLNICHRTTYRYREPVRLGPHRLMLRPRESRDVRLLWSPLEMQPGAGRPPPRPLAGFRYRRFGHPLPVLLFEPGADRSRGAGGAADLRRVGPARRLGPGFRA